MGVFMMASGAAMASETVWTCKAQGASNGYLSTMTVKLPDDSSKMPATVQYAPANQRLGNAVKPSPVVVSALTAGGLTFNDKIPTGGHDQIDLSVILLEGNDGLYDLDRSQRKGSVPAIAIVQLDDWVDCAGTIRERITMSCSVQ